VISLLVAGYVYVALPETKPAALSGVEETESMAKTFAGYGQVLRDKIFILFALGAMLMTMVYMQYNSTLPVYLRDNYQVTEQGYGFLLSLNAGMVVVFQFAITRRIRHRPPMLMMAVGTLLYAFGFSMYGFVETYFMFLLAIAVITVGEMVVAPVAQAIVAKMAPEEMRGRYMAVFGYTWAIPSMVGPLLAGLVMDNYDPRYLWYLAGMVAGAAALLFYALFRKDTLLEAGEMKASEGIH
jgi:MFS family permease